MYYVDPYSTLPGKVKYIAQTQRAYTALVTVAVGAAWRWGMVVLPGHGVLSHLI